VIDSLRVPPIEILELVDRANAAEFDNPDDLLVAPDLV
jgi:hypothetical protein